MLEFVDGAGHQAVCGLGGADGDRFGDGAGARIPQGLGGPLGGFGIDVVDDDGGSGRGEGMGVRESEALPGAGDDGDLAAEIEGIGSGGVQHEELPFNRQR